MLKIAAISIFVSVVRFNQIIQKNKKEKKKEGPRPALRDIIEKVYLWLLIKILVWTS